MSKKLLYISGSVIALLLAGGAAFASAQGGVPQKGGYARVALLNVVGESGTTLTVVDKAGFITTVDASGAKIMVNGSATVSGIKAGDTIFAIGTVNGNTLVATRIMGGAAPVEKDLSSTVTHGLVTAVDAAGGTITISVKDLQYGIGFGKGKGAQPTTTTMTVTTIAKTTKLVIPGIGKRASIKDIKVGENISVIGVVDPNTNTITAKMVMEVLRGSGGKKSTKGASA